MNSIHNNGKGEKSLDQDLEELDLKYQSVESDEPPEMLDQAILNRAHRAVEAKNSWLDFGWIHGLTTVGLVVLTFSVVVSLRDTGEFDPTIAPVSDKPLRSQNRKNASQASGELKAKKDADVDAIHQLSEKIATPASVAESKEILESTENRLEKQRQTPPDQKFSDDALSGQAAAPETGAAPFVSQPPIPAIPAAPPVKDSLKPLIVEEMDTSAVDDWKKPAEEDRVIVEQAKRERAAEERDIQAQTGLQLDVEVAAPISESENSAEPSTGLERTTAAGQVPQGKTTEAESDLNDLDIVGNLDLAEQAELLDIIMKHKLEGNENWKTELQTFINTYPDYPLPEELKP